MNVDSASTEQPRAGGNVGARRRWVALLIAAAVAVAFAPVFLRRPAESDWQRCFVRAATRMLAGEKIHVLDDHPYAYPPIMAFCTIPFAKVDVVSAMVAWYVVNVVAMSFVIASAWRLARGPQLRDWNRSDGLAFGLGIVLMARFLAGPLETRQFDVVIAALLLGGLVCLHRHDGAMGPVLAGIAASMKCTPLLFVPYLIWRGRFRAAAIVGVTAAGINLLPDVCCPQSGGGTYLVDWKEEFLDVSQRVTPGTWFSGLIQNQSLAGAGQRMLRYGLPTSLEAIRSTTLSNARRNWVRPVVYVGYGLLLVAAWIGFGRAGRSGESREDIESSNERFGIEASGILALMLLLSPMTSRAHFIVLLPPAFILTRRWVARRSAGAMLLLAVLLVLGPLTSKGLVGRAAGEFALAWSFPVLFSLLCFLAMIRERIRCRSDQAMRSQQPLCYHHRVTVNDSETAPTFVLSEGETARDVDRLPPAPFALTTCDAAALRSRQAENGARLGPSEKAELRHDDRSCGAEVRRGGGDEAT